MFKLTIKSSISDQNSQPFGLVSNSSTTEMDSFLQGVDPNLIKLVDEAVPEEAWPKLITEYKGPDTTEGHLEAVGEVIAFSLGLLKSSGLGEDLEQIRSLIKVQGLIQAELNNWPGAAEAWRALVAADDERTKDDPADRDLTAMFNLGLALNYTNHYAEAEDIYQRLLPLLEANLPKGKQSGQYIGSLTCLMLSLGKQHKQHEMMKCYEEHKTLTSHLDDPERSLHAANAKKVIQDLVLV